MRAAGRWPAGVTKPVRGTRKHVGSKDRSWMETWEDGVVPQAALAGRQPDVRRVVAGHVGGIRAGHDRHDERLAVDSIGREGKIGASSDTRPRRVGITTRNIRCDFRVLGAPLLFDQILDDVLHLFRQPVLMHARIQVTRLRAAWGQFTKFLRMLGDSIGAGRGTSRHAPSPPLVDLTGQGVQE